jgi:hypothetical protein
MPRRHAPFCDLLPDRRGHGPFCVSRPIARQVAVTSESGLNLDLTVDLAVRWIDPTSPRLVRAILEPPQVDERLVALLSSGAARQFAAALVTAAGQAEELDGNVSGPRLVF